jgi:D-glycero-alpha-D-manno-heptose-7-phosphate kinase
LKYSQSEDVAHASQLQHPIAREVLQRYNVTDVDIAVMADVPAGTGLGSSSAFTVAFLALVRKMNGLESTPADLAREACEIEIEILHEPIGYQDQWASAVGGINVLRFHSSGVTVERVSVDASTVSRLQSNLKLIAIGSPRRARSVLADQESSITPGSTQEDATRTLVSMVDDGLAALKGSMDDLGPLLGEAWDLKKRIAPQASNEAIDALYERGMAAGATGGKLLGAGGSGYLAFYVPAEAHEQFSKQMPKDLPFSIAADGAGVIHES